MDKMDHLMAERSKNNKNSQKGQVTPIFMGNTVLDGKLCLLFNKNNIDNNGGTTAKNFSS
jgi:hypothetical protein